MTMFRMPIFTWNMLVTGMLILIAFPVLTSALIMLFCDRHFGTHIYDVVGCTTTATAGHPSVPDPNACGSPVLWQNLFWFFGHPEVYILALPYFGIVTEVIPVFSRKPVFGYKGMVFATMSIAALSTGVWAHHMFTTGVVLLPFFSLLSLLIAVPTGIKFFNWIGTMWRGQLLFKTPMLFSIGFLLAFLMGGVTGVMLAAPPIDFFTHDTYFVVAHFHQVLFGTAVFAGFAGFYFWYPKMFGRMLSDPRQVALLADVRRLLADVHAAVHRRPEGHAPPGGHLPVQPRLADLQRPVHDRCVHHRRVVRGPPRQPLDLLATPGAGRRQPVGRPRTRVVHHVAAAAPQLHAPPTDPLRAADVGLPPSGRPLPPPRHEAAGRAAGQRQ
jgi:hypothetical protein